jgi:hypothetical protein
MTNISLCTIKFLDKLSDKVVGVAGDASESTRCSDRAASAADKGADADLSVIALAVHENHGTAAVTLKLNLKKK